MEITYLFLITFGGFAITLIIGLNVIAYKDLKILKRIYRKLTSGENFKIISDILDSETKIEFINDRQTITYDDSSKSLIINVEYFYFNVSKILYPFQGYYRHKIIEIIKIAGYFEYHPIIEIQNSYTIRKGTQNSDLIYYYNGSCINFFHDSYIKNINNFKFLK